MLSISPPRYKYCPFCSSRLQLQNGDHKKREACLTCNWVYYPHVGGASAGVIIRDNKVLLVQRKREPYKGTWMFPAGYIEFGEHPKEAMKREVKEEAGLNVKSAVFIDFFQAKDDYRLPGHFVFFYKAKVGSGKLKTDEDENSDIRWFSIMSRPKIGWQSHQKIMKRLQGGKI